MLHVNKFRIVLHLMYSENLFIYQIFDEKNVLGAGNSAVNKTKSLSYNKGGD